MDDEIIIQKIKALIKLQDTFRELYDEDFKLRNKIIYNKKIDSFNAELEENGIPTKLTPKELELKIQQELEESRGSYAAMSSKAQYEDKFRDKEDIKVKTFRRDEIEALQEKADERSRQSKAAAESSNQRVRDFERRNKEIFAEQQRIQNEIKAAESAKVKLDGKVLYAKVILPEPLQLDEIEQGELEVLRNKAAKETPEPGKTISPKVELINDLTVKIEEKIRLSLPTSSEEEIEIIARTAAVEIVDKIAKPIATELNIQTAIHSAINADTQKVVATVVKQDDELLIAAKNGSTLSALKIRDDELTSKLLIENLFGPKLGAVINGYSPEQIKVELTENRVDGQSEYKVDLVKVQESRIQILQNQDHILNSILDHGQKFGYDSIGNSFTSYARTYLAEKTAAMPVGSIVKKAYSDPIVQSILAKYGLANQVVWETTAQSGQFVNFLVRVSPDTAGPILNIAGRLSGGEYVTPIISLSGGAVGAGLAAQTAATTTSVTLTGGIMAGEAFAGGAGGAAAGAAAGSTIAPIIGTAIGAVVGALFGKAASAAKVWWTKHKDEVKPVLAVLTTIGAIRFLGIGPGLGVGALATFGLMGTAGLATIATGTIGVLGFIGRSIGIAIATPVIITLLIIPPLVAFIMLVINNSAYVVPPDARSLGLNLDNPYVLVTKVANPEKFENPTSNKVIVTYTVTIKALKSPLTKISITDTTCKVSKKNASTIQDCPPELENIPPLPADLTISPSSSYSFTFTSEFDSKYADSSIFDTIKIKATAEEKEIETSGSESVCIGDCPHGCFEISDDNEPWPDFGSKLEGATQRLTSEFPSFVDQSCIGREKVKLCYTTSNPTPNGTGGLCNGAIYAITSQVSDGDDRCVVNFNQCVFEGGRTDNDVFFLLTHELSHHIQWRDGGNMINKYENAGGPGELPLCSYSNTAGNPDEGSAEANALYANEGVASFSTCSMNFQSQYPNNYGFAQSYMNNP